MQAGRLRKRLEFWQYVPVKNAQGEQIEEWTLIDTVWGGLRPLNATERDHGDREIGEVSHEITLRVGKIDPRPGDQIRYKGRIFDLKPSRNIFERDRMLVIAATELLDQSGDGPGNG